MSEWDYDDRPELPEEAGDVNVRHFEPNNAWLAGASRDLQIEAMRQWFYARFQDPANDTPYNGREGGYLFIHGGPHDPDEEIQQRFSDFVEFEVMEELIQDLINEAGDEWAPIDHEYDEEFYYDTTLSLVIEYRRDPYRVLTERLGEIEEMLIQVNGLPPTVLVTQLAHGAVITALETYLWDTASYWMSNDDGALRNFVSTHADFGKEKILLSSIFENMDGLKDKVGGREN